MLVDRKTKLHLRAQAIIFYALFAGVVGALAYLSTQYEADLDWTAARRNSLDEASITLLGRLQGPIEVKAYATGNPSRRELIRKVIGRYQAHKPDLALVFVDPNTAPDEARALGIASDGTLIITMQGRTEKIAPDFRGGYPESDLSNALQRLARGGERFVVFLEGHGERRHDGEANHDLGAFGHLLGERGLKLSSLNLASAQRVPDNTALLVVASPQTALLPVEQTLLAEFVAGGGNLLWLVDPSEGARGADPLAGMGKVAAQLGVGVLPGVIVDPRAQVLGVDDPRMVIVDQYDPAPFTRDFAKTTVFPVAAGLELTEREGWTARPFASSIEQAWLETGPIEGVIELDGKDRAGPVTLGAWILRQRDDDAAADAPDQRIAVIADGDFLANQYVGNGGNLDLGLNLVAWLAADDDSINVNVKATPDATLEFSETALVAIAFGFLLGLPLLLLGSGLTIWWRRRRA
jgi:ABC-type uncharacterized transport system involved in gliding motility auxiliary subunit